MVASGNANDSPASATTKLPALTTASTPTPVAGSDAGRTSAFISYSRRDQEFVRALDDALVGRGFRVWVDWEDIPYGADFPSAILDNIEQNDTFLFVLSPDSLASEWCGKELAHAEENKKRIMPVVCRDVDLAHVPSALGHLNWLFMRTSDPFAQALDKLDTAITTDLDWVKAHSWLLQRAGRWDRAGRNASLLMRGKELQEADGWLAQASINRSKRPTPVQLQADYIIASRRTQRTRHRAVVAAISSVAVLALLLASVAWREKVIANQQRAVAVGEKKEVVRQQQLGRSRELAAEALAQLPTNPERGALLADQAVRRYPLTREAEAALRQASGATRVRAILYGHGDKVYDVAYSADGSRILTASRDETARVWDARTGREVVLLAGHVNTVTTAVFSPDRAGRYILTASWDGTARVWDARTGRSLRTLKVLGGRVGDVVSAAFSQDGRKIVTASADGTARVWAGDARAGASPVSPVTLRGHGCVHDAIATAGRDCTVYSALFSPGGFRVVTAGVDGTARVWDARTGHQLLILRVPTSWVYRALYSPDGKHIATAGGDGTARVWDATTGKLVATLTGHTGAINDLAFSPDGARLVTAGVDRTARVWTIATRQATMLSGHTDAVGAAMFSPNDGGARVLTVSNDHSARVWDAATGQELFALRGHTNAVDSGAFSPDGARVATASYDKTARTWDVSTGRIVASWPKGKATPDDFAAYSPDGNYVLTAKPGVAGLTANLWDAHSGGKPFTLTGHTQSINALSFDQRATKVATASDDGVE